MKLRDIRRSCGIVMIRESIRDCWTVLLGNMEELKEYIEFWWRNILKNVNFGHTEGT
jgi:hypothetical protein